MSQSGELVMVGNKTFNLSKALAKSQVDILQVKHINAANNLGANALSGALNTFGPPAATKVISLLTSRIPTWFTYATYLHSAYSIMATATKTKHTQRLANGLQCAISIVNLYETYETSTKKVINVRITVPIAQMRDYYDNALISEFYYGDSTNFTLHEINFNDGTSMLF